MNTQEIMEIALDLAGLTSIPSDSSKVLAYNFPCPVALTAIKTKSFKV